MARFDVLDSLSYEETSRLQEAPNPDFYFYVI